MSVASTVPEHNDLPNELNGVKIEKAETPKSWKNVDGQGSFNEPEFSNKTLGKKRAVGVIAVEPDKRVWVVHPTNQFGGYSATFPKGTVEHDLNTRENAIKETHEESGLKVHLDKHLGDFQRTTSVARYYLGRRVGGHPSHMGWESQKVSLVPMDELHKVVTHPADQPIIDAIRKAHGEK
jgi:8-oxo-dGTP pyrophosphatase MutT (NUDIX family)